MDVICLSQFLASLPVAGVLVVSRCAIFKLERLLLTTIGVHKVFSGLPSSIVSRIAFQGSEPLVSSIPFLMSKDFSYGEQLFSTLIKLKWFDTRQNFLCQLDWFQYGRLS